MLESLFTTDELVDSLRIIYKETMKHNSDDDIEMMQIMSSDGEILVLPVSPRTLYLLYSIIDKVLTIEFNKYIASSLDAQVRFNKLKTYDKFLSKCVSDTMNEMKNKRRFLNLRKTINDGLILNRDLMNEFESHKLKKMIMSIIDEEEGLVDVYHIANYINTYKDFNMDLDNVLVVSVNEYLSKASAESGNKFEKIADYGTAQEYFFKIQHWTLSRFNDGKTRMYYRNILNNGLRNFVKSRCKRMINLIIIKEIIYSIIGSLFCIINKDFLTSTIIILVLSFLYSIFRVFRIHIVYKCFEDGVDKENDILELLALAEEASISSWYKPYKE